MCLHIYIPIKYIFLSKNNKNIFRVCIHIILILFSLTVSNRCSVIATSPALRCWTSSVIDSENNPLLLSARRTWSSDADSVRGLPTLLFSCFPNSPPRAKIMPAILALDDLVFKLWCSPQLAKSLSSLRYHFPGGSESGYRDIVAFHRPRSTEYAPRPAILLQVHLVLPAVGARCI